MRIDGLQTLTLLDYPGKVACTVFTSGCNMRCPFCHNASLVCGEVPPFMEKEEFFAFLKKRTGVLDGVCVTGGEPLLQEGLIPFLLEVKEKGFTTKLDTNGLLHDRLRAVVEAGAVDYVAMDIKNCKARYAETAGVPGLDLAPIEKSVQFLMEGSVDYEFRTTVVKELHNKADFDEIGRWLKGAKRYFLQSFKDSGDILSPGLSPMEKADLLEIRDRLRAEIPGVELRGV
ncbi:MAG TPA: anaerobic ribonucleoside-triphosphate reductase activating protein [Candidatus Fimenecus excrementavium]|nr:anaerobic ribonucleoside-triphosphate reductase activating protein [Candidatus Fimenecus excrementavium]